MDLHSQHQSGGVVFSFLAFGQLFFGCVICHPLAEDPGAATDASVPAATATNDGYAEVRAVRGTASYSLEDTNWSPVSVQMRLRSGTILKTEKNSQVDFYCYRCGPVLRVTESSTLLLKTLRCHVAGETYIRMMELDLLEGRILGNVKSPSAGSRFEVKAPQGVQVHLTDADFEIEAGGVVSIASGAAEVECIDTSGKPGKYVVQTGQTYYPATKTEPAHVSKTPPPPPLLRLVNPPPGSPKFQRPERFEYRRAF